MAETMKLIQNIESMNSEHRGNIGKDIDEVLATHVLRGAMDSLVEKSGGRQLRPNVKSCKCTLRKRISQWKRRWEK